VGSELYPTALAVPARALPSFDDSPAIDARTGRRTADSYLRSSQEVMGYHIDASDGEIGHLDGFIVDDETWAIRYIEVATPELVAREESSDLARLDRERELAGFQVSVKLSARPSRMVRNTLSRRQSPVSTKTGFMLITGCLRIGREPNMGRPFAHSRLDASGEFPSGSR